MATRTKVRGAQFTRKPLTVEALQLVDADEPEDMLAFCGDRARSAYARADGVLTVEPGHTPVVLLTQADGKGAIVADGDWVIKTGDGFWHAKEADFLRDFEEAK